MKSRKFVKFVAKSPVLRTRVNRKPRTATVAAE